MSLCAAAETCCMCGAISVPVVLGLQFSALTKLDRIRQESVRMMFIYGNRNLGSSASCALNR